MSLLECLMGFCHISFNFFFKNFAVSNHDFHFRRYKVRYLIMKEVCLRWFTYEEVRSRLELISQLSDT